VQITVLAGPLAPDVNLQDYVFKRKAPDDLMVAGSNGDISTETVYQKDVSSSGGLVRFIYQLHGSLVITFRLEIPASQVDQEDTILEEINSIANTTTMDLSEVPSDEGTTTSNEFATPNVLAPMLTAGDSMSLYVDEAGHVWTWGRNIRGALGMPSTEDFEQTPQQIESFTDIIMASVEVSSNSSMALKSNGNVWVWGSYNELFYEESTLIGFIDNVKQVQKGNGFYLALRQDNTVWTWGNNLGGRLGNGGEIDSFGAAVQVSGLTDVVKLSSSIHSLALKSDGTVWAWG